MQTANHYIDGQWLDAVAGTARIGAIFNPATGEQAAAFCQGGKAEAEAAVAAARRAFEQSAWRNSPRLRADVMLDFAARLEAAKEDIADWLVAINGKLRREALGEIMAGVSEMKYYAGLARNQFGRILEVEPGCYASLDREAAGVAAIILPWNAPVTLLVRSLAPAMAAGCSVVIKPAHQTSVAHNLVMQCLVQDTRLPAGIINSVIESEADVSQYLCATPEVDVISFTGSSRVGKLIAASTAGTLKRLSLELGGKAPAIVFGDAQLDSAIPAIVAGALSMAGQQCTCIARVLVEDSHYDAVRDRLVQALRQVRVGPGNDPASQMGAMIDTANRDRILGLLDQAEQAGHMVHRGEIPAHLPARGAFLNPSLIAVEDLSSPFIQDELFGPLLVIERFSDEADALARANATRYSLAASVWTADSRRAKRLSARLKFGTVWHNAHNRLFAEAETGGYGDSGYGKLHGLEGMNDFMQTKHFYFETGN